MPSFFTTAIVAATAVGLVSAKSLGARDQSPNGITDPNTSQYCSWWYDNDGSVACKDVPDQNFITMASFLRWNPSITADCGNFITGHSYCVEALKEPAQPSTTSTPAKTSTTSKPATTTAPTTTSSTTTTPTSAGNGITTPTPTQPGLVSNCNKFYFVNSGDQCQTIADANGITLKQFTTWNSQAGDTCSGLWASAYACVGIIGFTPTTTAKATTTAANNGITTPTPTQPGLVSNCNKFYFVKSGDQCQSIADANGITLKQFTTWNSQAGDTCSGLWASAYACVGIVGSTPTTTVQPTTTKAGNGVTTPTPTQTGMVGNCKTFYFVQTGDTCQSISAKYSINQADFIKWNPAVKSDCTGMWSSTYACIGLI